MNPDRANGHDAQTTPIGARTLCPQCGAQLDSLTTTCGACGAVVTGGTMDTARMDRVRNRLQEGIGPGYRLGDMLGRGGMGIVFQARELSLDRDVALKVLAFDPILNPDAYDRFEREAKLAARLDHPNIVPIFAVGQGNGIAFYTMRMVRGGSVEGLVAGGTALPPDQALAILRDVAAALDYAHGQGVVHRDIKPANILLGDSGHAMVADFGIARAFSGPSSSGATATGTGVIGSPAYMSPEQWRGEKVDGRADQYALGVLAFELFAGTRPFAGDSMQDLLRMHLQEQPPDIISVRHDLSSHLSDPIRRAMAKDPVDRFTTSGEFVAALAGEPAPAPVLAAAGLATRASATTVRTPMPAGGTPPARPAARSAPTPAPAAPARPTPTPAPAAGARTVAQPAPSASRSGERKSVVAWLALAVIAAAGAGVIWKMSPSRGGAGTSPPPAAPATQASATPGPNLDSIARVEQRLQSEIASARKDAIAEKRRADSIAAASRAVGAVPAPPAKAPAHIYVFAEGGNPRVFIDGQAQSGAAPTLLQVAPGTHLVSVRGMQTFTPAETTITVAAADTGTVIFRADRSAAARGNRGASGRQGADPANAGLIKLNPATGKPELDWPAIIAKLGFDPRTANPRTLAPQQRQALRRFQQVMDSLRRATKRP